jgi:hypothetical protein
MPQASWWAGGARASTSTGAVWSLPQVQVYQAAPFLDLESAALDDHGRAVLDQTALHDLAGEDVVLVPAGAEPAEGADLEDAPVPFLRLGHRAAFRDEAGHGLFAEHVFAGFHGGDGNERVPMWRRGDGDQVNILALQHAAEVGVSGLVVGAVEPADVATGQLDGVQALHLVVGAGAASAAADEGAAEGFAGGRLASAAQDVPGHEGERRAGGEGAFEEMTSGEAVNRFHGWSIANGSFAWVRCLGDKRRCAAGNIQPKAADSGAASRP